MLFRSRRFEVVAVAVDRGVDAPALARVARPVAETRRAILVAHARLAALALAVAAAEAVRAGGAARRVVPRAADGRVAPRARVDVRIAELRPSTPPEQRRPNYLRGVTSSLSGCGVSDWLRFTARLSWRPAYSGRHTPPLRTSPSVQERIPLHEKRNARQCLPTRGVPDRDC